MFAAEYRVNWNLRPGPQYSCPTCRAIITTAPMHAYAIRGLIEDIPLLDEEGQASAAMPANEAASESFWNNFFLQIPASGTGNMSPKPRARMFQQQYWNPEGDGDVR
ncbi:hypothetical protein BC835DRAFT_1310718 [Cytidiella melzeri]|nr:hypothetical protein BC835DRAFT_1310718 [Cytidiella melzeri]